MVYCAAIDIGKSMAAIPMSKDFFFIIDMLDVAIEVLDIVWMMLQVYEKTLG